MRTISQILESSKTIAVVGLSSKPDRDSYRVASYLIGEGFTVFPVNPNESKVLGQKCYPSLLTIDRPIDIVVIFRRSELVQPIIEEAVNVKANVVWMQLGIFNQDAAAIAVQAGLDVVMDRCIKIEHDANKRA